MLGIFHVLSVISRRTLDKRRRVQYAKTPLSQSLSLADHLTIVVRMQSVAPAVPRHDEDDVPNVGSGGELDQVVESRKNGC